MKRLLVSVGVVILMATTSGAAQAGGDPLCELLQTCGEDPVDPGPAPAAAEIVFTNSNSGTADLYKVDSTSGAVSEVPGVNSAAFERDPAVSPDGKRVAFSSNRGRDFDIYVASLDGTGSVERVTSGSGDEFGAAWSPDGTRIAYDFAPSKGRDPTHVRILDLASGSDRALTTTKYTRSPAWSPDGTKVVVSGGSSVGLEIFVYTVADDSFVQLTAGTWNEAEKSPQWSPDGRWIVFTSYHREFEKGRHVMSDWKLGAVRPVDSDGDFVGDDHHIFYVAPNGGYVDQADWHPDGRSLAVSTDSIGRMALQEVDGRLNPGALTATTDGPAHYQPAWRPLGTS